MEGKEGNVYDLPVTWILRCISHPDRLGNVGQLSMLPANQDVARTLELFGRLGHFVRIVTLDLIVEFNPVLCQIRGQGGNGVFGAGTVPV